MYTGPLMCRGEIVVWIKSRRSMTRYCASTRGPSLPRSPLSARVRGSCDLASPPEWALCFCVPWPCLGLSLISALYLFSRSRVTCLRSWSPFFHTTNALWQQQPPPSKAFSFPRECLISQVCLHLKSSICALLSFCFQIPFCLEHLIIIILSLKMVKSAWQVCSNTCLIHTCDLSELGFETKPGNVLDHVEQ